MAVPKKRTSKSKKNLRKSVWKKKVLKQSFYPSGHDLNDKPRFYFSLKERADLKEQNELEKPKKREKPKKLLLKSNIFGPKPNLNVTEIDKSSSSTVPMDSNSDSQN